MKNRMKKLALLLSAGMIASLTGTSAFAGEVTATGSANGIDGLVTVEVVATPHEIISIDVIEQNETAGIGSVAVEELPAAIIATQSLQVDGIAGATITSDAIKDAVRGALNSADISLEPFEVAAGGEDVGEEQTEGDAAEDSKDLITDVVVVGAGGAGMTAAIQAADEGAYVVLVESQPLVGGNSVRSTGGLNAADTEYEDENVFGEDAGVEKTLAAAADTYADNKTITKLAQTVQGQWEEYQEDPQGYFDSVELMELDTMIGGKGINNPKLVKVLCEDSADAIEWLESIGAPMPSVSSFGGASVKRIHRPLNDEGKVVPVGSYVVPILKENVESRENITLLMNTTAEEILMEDGAAAGIIATDENGEQITIHAESVVLATGGFGANLEKVTELKPELDGFMTTNAPGIQGQGIEMAEAIGAATVDMEQIQIHPTVEANTASLITEGLRGDGAILVNAEGKRFIDEVGTRDVVSAAEIAQTGSYSWLVVDQAMTDASSVIQGYINKGFTVTGDDYAALAEAMGVDAAAFEETMNTWNGYVENKEDPDFGRTSFANPLNTAPYYAVKVTAGIHHTMGGLKINQYAEVLDTNGDPITGLFAAGEVTGGVHGANRLGGNAVADFTVFGRIAGEHAAGYALS